MKKIPLTKAVKIAAQVLFRGNYNLTFDQLEFPLARLPVRKRLSLMAQGAQIMVRPAHWFALPPILQVEPINRCNLRCPTCASGAGMLLRPPRPLSFDLFREIIDQTKDSLHLLVFWSWGEPFMNKEAFRMIRYAKDSGLLVHTSSNGHFFDTREKAKSLIDSGLDSLIMAVDGLDQSTYEKYRRGGNLKVVIRSIENVVAERASRGCSHPFITFRFIVMRHNEHQVGQVRGFAESLGVDAVSFRSAVAQRGQLDLRVDLTPTGRAFQLCDRDGGQPADASPTPSAGFRCRRPYANLTIFSNGDVVLCENDFNATNHFGNVKSQGMSEISASPRLRRLLMGFRLHLKNMVFCRTCEFNLMERETANLRTYALKKPTSGVRVAFEQGSVDGRENELGNGHCRSITDTKGFATTNTSQFDTEASGQDMARGVRPC